MKQGIELPALAEELSRQADAKRDYIARADSMTVSSNGRSMLHLSEPFALTDTGHATLAQYLEVPKSYYDRLRGAVETLTLANAGKEAESLFDATINSLLANKRDDRRLIRTLDGKARAVLSNTYSLDFDNLDVYKACLSAMDRCGLSAEDVVSCAVTDRMLYVKIVSPKLEATITHRDAGPGAKAFEPQVVRAGVVIRNSEVGSSSLSVQPLVYKLVCSNGLIVESGLRRRHVGTALDEGDGGSVYRSDTRAAEAAVKLLKVRDEVAAALDMNRFKSVIERIAGAAATAVEAEPAQCVEVTASKYGLSDSERDRVLSAFLNQESRSHWSLVDAITEAARSCESYDRATEMEVIGGRVLTLAKAQLRELICRN